MTSKLVNQLTTMASEQRLDETEKEAHSRSRRAIVNSCLHGHREPKNFLFKLGQVTNGWLINKGCFNRSNFHVYTCFCKER